MQLHIPDGGLNEVVSLQVHGGCRFIQDQHLGLPEEGPHQAHQLPLTHREVGAALGNDVIKATVQLGGHVGEVGQPEGVPDLPVCVLAEWVQVEPDKSNVRQTVFFASK